MALAVDEYGEGEPLLLIHGLGTDRGVWADAAPLLAHGRRVIAIDLPGFGDSPPAGEGFDLRDVAVAIDDGLRERIPTPYRVLGHSLGGAVALMLARTRPDRVAGLILSAPAGFRPRSEPLARAAARSAPALLHARRLVGGRLVRSPVARRALLWGALHDAGRIAPERARSMLEASGRARRLPEATRAAVTADLAGQLRATEIPAGMMWGERDPLMPEPTTEAIRRCRPEAPVELVRDAGHVTQVEQPELFAAAVDRLLMQLDPVTVS
jgi:pimeloyl-ACP methyl ester carboxylesterase